MTAVAEQPRELGRSALRGLGWSTIGNVSLRLLNVCGSILIAHLIAPNEFGVFAVGLTVWTVVGSIAEFGLGSDLVRTQRPAEKEPTVASIAVLFSGGLAAAMVALAGPLARAFGSPESDGVIRLLAASLAVSGLGIVPAARLQRGLRQRAVFGVNAAGALTSLLFMVPLALAGVGAAALAWGQLAGQVVAVLGMHAVSGTRPRFGFVAATARASILFCLPLACANLLSWLLVTLDNVIVVRQLGPVQLGMYALAFNISSWPMTAIGQSVRVIALPVFARLRDPVHLSRALVLCMAPLVMVAALVSMLLSALAAPLVGFVYGGRWEPAAAALGGLAVFGGLRVLSDFVATVLIAVGATMAVFVVQVAWLAVMLPAMILGVAQWGIRGAGWTQVVVAAAIVVPAYLFSLRRVGVGIGPMVRAALIPLVATAPAALVCAWIGRRSLDDLVLLLCGGIAALVLYAAPLTPSVLHKLRELRRESRPSSLEPIGQQV